MSGSASTACRKYDLKHGSVRAKRAALWKALYLEDEPKGTIKGIDY
jgi:hypothetical protein